MVSYDGIRQRVCCYLLDLKLINVQDIPVDCLCSKHTGSGLRVLSELKVVGAQIPSLHFLPSAQIMRRSRRRSGACLFVNSHSMSRRSKPPWRMMLAVASLSSMTYCACPSSGCPCSSSGGSRSPQRMARLWRMAVAMIVSFAFW